MPNSLTLAELREILSNDVFHEDAVVVIHYGTQKLVISEATSNKGLLYLEAEPE